MTFRLDHHNKILTILKSFNQELLHESFAYFGGGTLITLEFEEYRWSKDIDFICPISTSGYKQLRTVIYDGGHQALFNDLSQIQIGHSTTDQYGIRMLVTVDNTPIKTEIIAEVRFELDPPRYPEWTPVPCLSINDCFTAKLLANSDRYMDRSIEARDLIDLAVLRLNSPIPQSAIDKAENAYEVIRPLKEAVRSFQEKPEFRDKCFTGLQIDNSQLPKIIDGIDLLAEDLGLVATERTFKEQQDLFGY
jgi:predicted nucleotidyltransferase component of viral defense system